MKNLWDGTDYLSYLKDELFLGTIRTDIY